jgi:hypothetical protein
MNENETNYSPRPLLGFELLRIEQTMNQISDSLNPKFRKRIMRKLRKDLKILIGEPGDLVVVNGNGVYEIVDTLHIGGEAYALGQRHPKSFVMEDTFGTA